MRSQKHKWREPTTLSKSFLIFVLAYGTGKLIVSSRIIVGCGILCPNVGVIWIWSGHYHPIIISLQVLPAINILDLKDFWDESVTPFIQILAYILIISFMNRFFL